MSQRLKLYIELCGTYRNLRVLLSIYSGKLQMNVANVITIVITKSLKTLTLITAEILITYIT